MTRYFEDFVVGDTFELGDTTMTRESMLAFATQYDPQPFHVDEEKARDSVFGGLIASGWQTAALFMRLVVDNLLCDTLSMGSPGLDEIRWLKPVRPGDTLRARFTVLDTIPSTRKSDRGTVRSLGEMLNQRDEVVMTLKGLHILGRRS
ncbi:MAG TPA: MaoC family dehydratase [Ktedonobacterales bacterium]|nr:MaoC family dehydratase [Ktedonobacterales bacterium]